MPDETKSEAGYTKGPWRFVECGSDCGCCDIIQQVKIKHVRPAVTICNQVFDINDSRLIAAAPDLLEALRLATGKLQIPIDNRLHYSLIFTGEEIKAMEAAIANATGKGE